MILVTDIHGCYNTLLRLLTKCPQEEQLVFCGDLIDRGPNSRQVVEFAMENKIPTVMGNHEHLALYHHRRVESDLYDTRRIWIMNGGDDALGSWGANKLPDNVLDWMQSLPYYLKYDDLLVSHTGHGAGKKGHQDDDDMLLWYRDTHFEDDGLFRVFGHTQEAMPVITDTYAMIDTGAAYKSRGYGVMTAFQWPSKKVFQQVYDETPL
jgi:serine/threonine protein phosphatase 1